MVLPKVFHQSTKYKNRRKGFLLLEISLTIIFISFISSFVILTLLAQRETAQLLPDYNDALKYTKLILQKTISLLSPQENIYNGFHSYSTIEYISPCLLYITASTTWNISHTHSVSLKLLAANPQEINNLGNDCGGYSGETHLRQSTIKTPISYLFNNIITAFDAQSNAISLATANSNSNFITASLNSNLNTISILGTTTIPVINSLDSISNYTFAAVQGTSSQFQIIDTSDLYHPTIIKRMSLPGVSATGSYPSGLSIFYYNNKIYIGTHRTAGNEFHIYDVSTPSNPVWLGSIELNHNINDIVVSSSTAYLATSGNSSDIIILDVSTPSYIKKTAEINIPNDEDSLKIAKLGNNLFVGRDKGKTVNNPELYIIDCSSTTNPSPAILKTYSFQSQITGIKPLYNTVFISSKNGLYSVDFTGTSSPLKLTPTATTGLDIESNTLQSVGSSTLTIFK